MPHDKAGPNAPVAVRPSNVENAPEPTRAYRKTLAKQPHNVEARRESFRRNRERALRRAMRP